QRSPLIFLLQRWRRDRPGRRRGCCGSQTLPQKLARGLRPNHPSVPPAPAARFAERTIADEPSPLPLQRPESVVPFGDRRPTSHAFAPPPPGLPVVCVSTHR